MDVLKAEIERKRKAKQDEFGGKKYVKRSQITAVREGKLRQEEENEWRAKHGKGPLGPGSAEEEARMAEEEARLKQLQTEAEDNNANPKVRVRARVTHPRKSQPRRSCQCWSARVSPRVVFCARRKNAFLFYFLFAFVSTLFFWLTLAKKRKGRENEIK